MGVRWSPNSETSARPNMCKKGTSVEWGEDGILEKNHLEEMVACLIPTFSPDRGGTSRDPQNLIHVTCWGTLLRCLAHS